MGFPVRSLPPDLFLAELALTPDAVIVDVRTREEADASPAFPEAMLLDFLDTGFEDRIEDLDRLQPHYVVCDTGKRSRMAGSLMASRGFILVTCLDCGLNGLAAAEPAD